jgi:hypothetical protein
MTLPGSVPTAVAIAFVSCETNDCRMVVLVKIDGRMALNPKLTTGDADVVFVDVVETAVVALVVLGPVVVVVVWWLKSSLTLWSSS